MVVLVPILETKLTRFEYILACVAILVSKYIEVVTTSDHASVAKMLDATQINVLILIPL
jgi:hypothetical protein